MTDHDDRDGGGDDDPQLRALRGVWLDMRDEEPPSRGLDALMAAARVKAVEMREATEEQPSRSHDDAIGPRSSHRSRARDTRRSEPSLWQRIASLLRKPPVLALASVMILVGGVALLARRGENIEVEPPMLRGAPAHVATGSAAPLEAPAAATTAESLDEAADEAGPRTGPSAVVTPDPSPAGEAKPSPARRPKPARSSRPSLQRLAEEKRQATDRLDEPRPTGTERAESGARAFESELVVGGAEPDAEAKTTRETDAASDDAARGGTSSRTTLFLTEARSAATRGDCARAQAWLKRLAAEDATAYRRALASDAALRACMVE